MDIGQFCFQNELRNCLSKQTYTCKINVDINCAICGCGAVYIEIKIVKNVLAESL